MLVVVLLSVDDGLGMVGFELAVHVLWVRMRDGLGMCDFILTGFALENCGGCEGLLMGQC